MDEELRAFVMKILKGMIEEGKASSDIRRYAFARLQDHSINFDDVQEIDRLLEERDNPPVISELISEENSEVNSEDTSAETMQSSAESEVEE